MAEHLDVTEEFLKDALDAYLLKYGKCTVVDNYMVFFEPLGVVDMNYGIEYAIRKTNKGTQNESKRTVSPKTWDDIEEVEPNEVDLAMLKEVEENSDCHEFISQEEAMKELGL